ncbi:alkaline-phosphatase-like protein [Trichophaea hybrida]|nr:alkaline-phosphatase-like protein [Trichophaea hybrida]
MARDYVHWNNNATTFLPIDEMVIGSVRTRATDSYVTDSAASATAYSCGIKSYNGAIGVNDDYAPCGTVLEAAHLQGFKTGLIVTSRITHATPATFASHIYDRDLESEIALQEIGYAHPLGRTVDILLGGGRCFFTPNTTATSCRKDSIDALALAKGLGYTVFSDRKTFDSKKLTMPYLGLFTDDHMSYEADRDPTKEPSLKEMAIRGINDLYAASKDSEKGFFVLVEASRIDHAGHANDPVGHLYDILAYNSAMLAMRQWIDKHPDSPTTLISTADHECGGLTVGVEIDSAPDYWYAPEHFSSASATSGSLAAKWAAYTGSDLRGYLKTEIFGKYGITTPTEEEYSEGLALKADKEFAKVLTKSLSKRLGVNWATGGHTAADVTLYGWGVGVQSFRGMRENNEVGLFIAKQLGLKLEGVTERLQKNESWVKEWVMPKEGGKVVRRGVKGHHHHH